MAAVPCTISESVWYGMHRTLRFNMVWQTLVITNIILNPGDSIRSLDLLRELIGTLFKAFSEDKANEFC